MGDDLRVRREEEVFESLIKWMNADEGRSGSDLEGLLPHVRFPFMSPQYLLAKVEQHPITKVSSRLPELLLEAKNHMLLSLSSAQSFMSIHGLEPHSPRTSPRVEFGDV